MSNELYEGEKTMDPRIDHIASDYICLIPLLYRKLDNPIHNTAGRKTTSELTHLQFHILEEMFHQKEGISMTQLAKMIRISKQQLTPLVSKLEEKSYVIKEPDNNDKRLVRLRLTEKGITIVSQRWEGFHRELCEQMARLNEEDRIDLDFAITKITRILDRLE
jgi:DNA-binding MarR family transcriptional regulator